MGLELKQEFSSLSESGFIPTRAQRFCEVCNKQLACSHLFQRVASFLHGGNVVEIFRNNSRFSSLSESGFIPTFERVFNTLFNQVDSSHLFQRVASFLQSFFSSPLTWGLLLFSSLSESGFIPTNYSANKCKFRTSRVLISFREWLHSYD